MTAGNDYDPQPELFSALLTPHRSLSRTGFIVLMVFLSVVSFVAGLSTSDVNPACNSVFFRAAQVQIILIDKVIGHLDQ